MKYYIFLVVLIVGLSVHLPAQQRLDPAKMNYLINPKPNSILYHDTLYKGNSQYKWLFYKTRDSEIIHFYQKHQSNKIWGNITSTAGLLTTAGGIIIASRHNSTSHTAGWVTAGTGLACTIFGGYLMVASQQNMSVAVGLFNSRYNKAVLGIGISGDGAGLVINF